MKRTVDLLIVIPGLIAVSPLMIGIMVLIKATSPGPVLFRQWRVGLGGRQFRIFKFRTMVHEPDRVGVQMTVAGDPRITRWGRFLRRWKLDELPQLFNVLSGDMTLVGPRPQVARVVNHYPAAIRRRVLSVRPGLTHPAAIVYRHEEQLLASRPSPERMYYDQILPHKLALYLDYLDRRSVITDLRVLCQTAWYLWC